MKCIQNYIYFAVQKVLSMYQNDPLWLRIQTYNLDDTNSEFPFSKKLAKENNWTHNFALNAIEEYKRFIYLSCISSKGASPSFIVDQVWHLHLTYTVTYWKVFCPKVLQRELHHHPSKGGASETMKYDSLYDDTIELYQQVFNEEPPTNFWSASLKRKTILEHNGLKIESGKAAYLVFVIPFIVSQILFHTLNPYALKGPQFLVFFVITMCCTALYVLLRFFERRQVVHSILDESNGNLDAFELAFIVRGKSAYQQMVMVDLIEQNKIEPCSESFYMIHKKNLLNTFNPVNHFLLEYPDEKIEFNQIMSNAYKQASELEDRFPLLKHGYDIQWLDYLPHICIVVMAVLRIMQGLVNGNPVSILVFMLFAFVIISVIITGSLKVTIRNSNALRLNENHTSHIQSDAQRLLLFSGAASLLALPMFVHLNQRPFFNDRVNDSSSGCGSSCGSDGGGGGCGGGGCGGCGGGD